MKKAKDKYNSISDLANEFQVSKAAIELYGVHGLLPPISSKTTRPVYRLIDKVRLKFIIRAKNADYTIGNIKELIGVLDLKNDEADQMEESLVYSKKKSAELTESLEKLDALEQINVTCDLELLEAYITDLNNLKYGLNDITPINATLPDPNTESTHSEPRTPVYSHIANQINAGVPTIAPKKSRMPLVAVAGILLVAIAGYLYFGGDPVRDTADNPAVPLQIEPAEMTAATTDPNETDEMNLPETDTNSDEDGGNPVIETDSKEDLFSLLDFPALKNDLNSPSDDPVESRLESYSDEQTQTETTQNLLDAINEPRATTLEPDTSEKEDTEDVFFKQLVADMKKKYDEQAQSQTPPSNDTVEINAIPEKTIERKETQNLTAVAVPNDGPPASKTTTVDKALIETKSKTTAATSKTPQKKITTAPPKTAAPLLVTKRQPPTSTRAKPPTTKSTKSSSPVVAIKDPIKKATVPTKKVETPKLPTSDESASKAITPPKPKPKPKPKVTAKPKIKPKPERKPVPEPKPEPDPKPKTISQKPANPEALKWTQKSYESVMSGDAGEAIIAATVAITLDPNLVNAYINRSWAYSKKGQYDRAIQDCDKALAIDNENALAYNNRGLAFQGKDDLDKARADYERACTLGFDIGCKNFQEVVGNLTGKL